jgi:hypothetical protein
MKRFRDVFGGPRFGLPKPANWRTYVGYRPEPFRAVPFGGKAYKRQAESYYAWLAETRGCSVDDARAVVDTVHRPILEAANEAAERPAFQAGLFDMAA